MPSFPPVYVTGRSVSIRADQNMTVTAAMRQDLGFDYFSKYEVRVAESTVKGWDPYSLPLLFKIGEGGM